MTGEWDAPAYDRVADPQAGWGAAVLERLQAAERAGFVSAVAARMPAPELDYVRLNIVARRAAKA